MERKAKSKEAWHVGKRHSSSEEEKSRLGAVVTLGIDCWSLVKEGVFTGPGIKGH